MKPSIRVISLVLVCLLSLGLSPGTCSAYQIMDSELTQLNQNLNNLESIIVTLRSDLILSKNDLVTARTELISVQKELLQSRDESKQIKLDLMKANELSLKAETSLTKYEKEVNSEIRKLKLERDMGIVAVIAMAFIKH